MIRKRPKMIPGYFRNNFENCKQWHISQEQDVVQDCEHLNDYAIIEDTDD